MTKPRHLILNLNPIPGGIYAGAWRTGERPPESFISIEHFNELAEIAERGKLDALFLADNGGLILRTRSTSRFARLIPR
ncbi:hypothetical protein ACD578_28885 (plasmid) [Microvirga sp. RSM25]|uniref:hypothetical protein n=1 Tax=Microvirga sp. RSM25 TaxID=3273802 RepID=UPI00384DFA1B